MRVATLSSPSLLTSPFPWKTISRFKPDEVTPAEVTLSVFALGVSRPIEVIAVEAAPFIAEIVGPMGFVALCCL